VLFGRQVFAALNKGATDALQVLYDVQYPAAVGGALFSDDFSSGTDGQPLAAPWAMLANVSSLPEYSAGTAAFPDGTSAAYVSGVSAADGYVQARTMGSASYPHVLIARYTHSPGSHYHIQINTGTLYLSWDDGSTNHVLTSAPVTFSAGAVLRLECQGTTLRGYYGGQLHLTYTDVNLSGGAFGLLGNSANASFDDFECGTL
jgi:hypothetical protein